MKQVSRSEYSSIHIWLRSTFGNAIACENPKCEKRSQNFQYALKAGKTHKRLRANYMTLCGVCHVRYDREHDNRGHQKEKSPERLSMKLLWKYLTEYQKTEEYKVAQITDTLQISRFLEFVESEMKSPKK